MSFSKKITILAIASLEGLYSCSKKDAASSTTTPTPKAKGVTFKVDGTAVTCDSANATLYTLGVSPFNRMIDVYAYKSGSLVLELHFQPKAGSYTADKTFTNSWLTYATTTDYFDSKSGTMKLTKCDTSSNIIEADFDFVGENPSGSSTHSITEGNINLDKITKH